MAVAALALVGLLISVYLMLHQLGLVGSLACGPGGGCEKVQASRWAYLAGIPVAAFGVAGYLALLGVALVGLQQPWLERPAPTRWLALLSGAGVLFTLYLTYLELFRIHAICPWCVGSAVVISAIFVVSVTGVRSANALLRTLAPRTSPSASRPPPGPPA